MRVLLLLAGVSVACGALAAPQIAITDLVGWDGSAHFAVTSVRLTRAGNAIQLHGKGALRCNGDDKGVIVLSLGTPG